MSEKQDESFALLLAEYDDQLQVGVSAQATQSMPVGQEARLRDAQDFLQLLEACWPRGKRRGREFSAEQVLPKAIGRFSIQRILGQGGTGIVYLAHDPVLGREIALKVPRLEVILTPERHRRFLREAQAAALLAHPNIIPIHEVSESGELCFIVYSYCPGPSLAQWLQRHPEPISCAGVSQLVRHLAETIEHAHRRGILHRDLKPGNILLEFQRRKSPEMGANASPALIHKDQQTKIEMAVPKITDFGLAKVLLDEADLTQTGLLMGTPTYMAPEQTHGMKEVGPACDVWALGVILYELLTRQRPFIASTPLAVMNEIQQTEPPRPRRLRADVPRDLEAICLKCLEKAPARRYATALELAEDLGRFLDHKPTQARPVGQVTRSIKSIRRHPTVAALMSLIVAGLLLTLAGIIWRDQELVAHNRELDAAVKREKELAGSARKAQALAEERERQVHLQAYVTNIGVADRFCKENRLFLARDLLGRQLTTPEGANRRDFAWCYLWRRTQRELTFPLHFNHPVVAIGFSEDGRRLSSTTVTVWLECHDLTSGHRLQNRGVSPAVNTTSSYVKFSRNANRVALFEDAEKNVTLEIFDTANPGVQAHYHESLEPRGLRCYSMDFSPDGERFVFCPLSDREEAVIKVVTLKDKAVITIVKEGGYRTKGVAFSPDGNKLSAVLAPGNKSSTAPGLLMIHDFKTGIQMFVPSASSSWHSAHTLLWSPDGKTLACAALGQQVALWNAQPLTFRSMLPVLCDHPCGMAFSPNGKHLAVIDASFGSKSRKVRTFQVHDGKPNPREYESVDGHLQSVAWSPTENLIALAGRPDDVRFWNPLDADEDRLLHGHQAFECWGVAFAPDGKTLASVGDDHTLRLWNPATGVHLGQQEGHLSLASCLAYSPNGRWIATGSYDKSVRLCNAARPVEEIHRFQHEHHLRCVAFSHDSKVLASGGRDRVVRLWNPETGNGAGILEGHSKTVRALAFHPQQNLLASASDDRTVCIWDPDKKALLYTLPHYTAVWSLAFSPDGKTLVTGSADGLISFWNVVDGKVLATLHRHAGGIRSLAFSPDGKTLASGSQDKTVRLINPELAQELFVFPVQAHEINGVAFSPEGTFLAAALHDGTIALWHGPK